MGHTPQQPIAVHYKKVDADTNMCIMVGNKQLTIYEAVAVYDYIAGWRNTHKQTYRNNSVDRTDRRYEERIGKKIICTGSE